MRLQPHNIRLTSIDKSNYVNCLNIVNLFCECHLQHHCCGVNKPSDWEPVLENKNPLILPPTCCKLSFEKCTVGDAIQIGCKAKMSQYVEEYYIVWFGLGFTVIILIEVCLQ